MLYSHFIDFQCHLWFRILKVLSKELRLSEEISLHSLSRNTPGFVGADLSALVREAASNSIQRSVFLEKNHGLIKDL